MSNSLKRIVSPVRDPELNKRRAVFNTPTRPPRNTPDQESMPINTATPSCSTPCNSSNTCITNNRTAVPITVNHNGSNFDLAFNTPVQFASESSLQEHELLLYSIMTLAFPTSPFSKNYTPCKYDPIVNVMFQITGVKFSNQGIRNYFHRVNTNKVKGIGKTNGVCRWIYYQKNIESFLQSNKHLLTLALQGEQLTEQPQQCCKIFERLERKFG